MHLTESWGVGYEVPLSMQTSAPYAFETPHMIYHESALFIHHIKGNELHILSNSTPGLFIKTRKDITASNIVRHPSLSRVHMHINELSKAIPHFNSVSGKP